MKLYHGSKKIVSMPIWDNKTVQKDFGGGFYATESEELAREWAAADENGGFINIYELDTEGLKVIDLCSSDRDIREWLAVISNNRVIPSHSKKEEAKGSEIIRQYLPDLTGIDMIKGYRADDSTFSLCRAFLTGRITAEKLQERMVSSDTGEQVLLCSEKALNRLEYLDSDAVDGGIYYPKRRIRDLGLMNSLSDVPVQSSEGSYPAVYLNDAMRCLGELLTHVSQASDVLSEDRMLKMFIASGYASRFEKGDPHIISGMSGVELFYRIMEKCGEYRYIRKAPDIISERNEAYTCGMLLAYYQWQSRQTFAGITSAMSYARLSALFPEFSALPQSEACVIIDKKLRERRSSQTRLQAQRKRLGLSQRELAAYSGVNLRTLQQYEVGDKDINRAAADKAAALSRTLYCSPYDLLE